MGIYTMNKNTKKRTSRNYKKTRRNSKRIYKKKFRKTTMKLNKKRRKIRKKNIISGGTITATKSTFGSYTIPKTPFEQSLGIGDWTEKMNKLREKYVEASLRQDISDWDKQSIL